MNKINKKLISKIDSKLLKQTIFEIYNPSSNNNGIKKKNKKNKKNNKNS